MPAVTDIQEEFTPPPEEDRNVRRCLTTDMSSMADNVSRLPAPYEQHLRDDGIIRNHERTAGAAVPIPRIFKRFRNMSINGLQSNYLTHKDIPYTEVCHPSLATLNHAYLYLDANDCIVRPEIINIQNNNRENMHQNHIVTKHSRAHKKYAHNEVIATDELLTLNSDKRKNMSPLSTARPKEASSNINIKRRLDTAYVGSRIRRIRN
nr:hypothetical protein [Tanacetum cinerariifolium]